MSLKKTLKKLVDEKKISKEESDEVLNETTKIIDGRIAEAIEPLNKRISKYEESEREHALKSYKDLSEIDTKRLKALTKQEEGETYSEALTRTAEEYGFTKPEAPKEGIKVKEQDINKKTPETKTEDTKSEEDKGTSKEEDVPEIFF